MNYILRNDSSKFLIPLPSINKIKNSFNASSDKFQVEINIKFIKLFIGWEKYDGIANIFINRIINEASNEDLIDNEMIRSYQIASFFSFL